MIDGTYRIQANTPFGSKVGTVRLRADNDLCHADIDAPIIGRQYVEGRLEDENSFAAEGMFRLGFMGSLRYSMRGVVVDDTLNMTIRSNRGDFVLTGRRMSAS